MGNLRMTGTEVRHAIAQGLAQYRAGDEFSISSFISTTLQASGKIINSGTLSNLLSSGEFPVERAGSRGCYRKLSTPAPAAVPLPEPEPDEPVAVTLARLEKKVAEVHKNLETLATGLVPILMSLDSELAALRVQRVG